jgi:hypothetical protein
MEAKHTPGPWAAFGCDVGTLGPRHRVICWTGQPEVELEEARANARLIAAAPDMLTALQTIALHISSLDAQGVRELCDAAIAQATGKE